jgi:radical SAM-linked protein
MAGEAMDEPQAPARQRWRLVLARAAGAPPLGGRELIDAWEQALGETGLPLYRPAGRSRARFSLGAPLPIGMAAERELADIVLTEVVSVWRVREALSGRLPDGWKLVELFDVWLGSPALAGRVTGAGYQVIVEGAADAGSLAGAAARLLEERQLPRTRLKGGLSVAYDLRPLLIDVVVIAPGPPPVLRIRTRIHQELGTGRPEEVVAALVDQLGSALVIASITRERLILVDDD